MATSASREPMNTAFRKSTSPDRICFTNCQEGGVGDVSKSGEGSAQQPSVEKGGQRKSGSSVAGPHPVERRYAHQPDGDALLALSSLTPLLTGRHAAAKGLVRGRVGVGLGLGLGLG